MFSFRAIVALAALISGVLSDESSKLINEPCNYEGPIMRCGSNGTQYMYHTEAKKCISVRTCNRPTRLNLYNTVEECNEKCDK